MIKIEVEGKDASGKTTALKYLISQAKKKGLNVIETREVGNPHIASCVKMRELVLNPENNLSGEAMELIFSAMRVESDLWLQKLQNSYNIPDLVVSDRGFFSHLAYGRHNTSEQFVTKLFENLMATITAMPDVVIYFRIDAEVAKQRMIGRGQAKDVIELKGTEFQKKVADSFESYLTKYRENGMLKQLYVVDANQDIPGVQKQLDAILEQLYRQ